MRERATGRIFAAGALVLLAVAAWAQDGRREVVVVDPDGRPVPGVEVTLFGADAPCGRTGADGRLALPASAGAGPVDATLRGAGDVGAVLVEGRKTSVTAAGLPSLTVLAHSAANDEPLDATGAFAVCGDVAVPLTAGKDGAFVAPVIAASAGKPFLFGVHVVAPDGFADAYVEAGAAGTEPAPLWGRAASEVLVDVPLWPEGFARLRAVDRNGKPVANARVEAVIAGSFEGGGWPTAHGTPGDTTPATGADGVLVLRDLPLVPGQELEVRLRWSSAVPLVGTVRVSPADAEPDAATDVTLLPPAPVPVRVPDAGADEEEPLPDELPVLPHDVEAERATLDVVAELADGRPAARCEIVVRHLDAAGEWKILGWQRTDVEGRLRIEGMPPGNAACTLAETGVLRWSEKIELAPGAKAELKLEEPVGRNLLVHVQTESGERIVGAAVRVVLKDPVEDLALRERATQPLATFTDSLGTAVLRGVPYTDDIVVLVRRGTLHGRATPDMGDASMTVTVE